MGTVSIPRGVETQREVSGAGVAKPEMFAPPQLPLIAIERSLGSEGRVSARNSLPSRSERKGTVQLGLAHLCSMGWSPVFSSMEFWPESATNYARKRPNDDSES
jgi:hypothetical protein